MRWLITSGLAALVLAATAQAHVAPAVGDNNRYLKLTPLADRVRLSYTVFYGETPGAELRQALDRNHDGAIDDRETEAFGEQLAGEIAGSLVVTLDGVPAPVAWSQVVVGLGTPKVAAGAFSVDLVAWLCLASPRGAHAVRLRDHYPIPRPGETEVKVEDSPGVTIKATAIGGAIDEEHDYKLVGPSGALDTEGLELTFTAGDNAAVSSDAMCRRASAEPRAAVIALIVAAAAVLAGIIAVVVRRRPRSGSRRRRA
jgi:hypothetical protein